MDLRISLIITFAWSLMSPYMQVLKGLLTVETVSIFMIIGSISMETLIMLNKRTTFKSSTLYVIIYDMVFLICVSLGYMFLDDRNFIVMVMVMTIPYMPLVRNAGNKYKGLMGERYPRYFVEHVNTKISILENRVGLIAMGTAGLITALTVSPRNIVLLFILVSTSQTIWSIYVFKKYYTIFNR